MSILVNKDTKVIVQGLTGKTGTFHTEQALSTTAPRWWPVFTRKRVARNGCRLGRPKLPIFASVAEGKEETGANASVIYVPPAGAGDAIIEAIDAGSAHRLHHRRHSGLPIWSSVKAKLDKSNSRLIGPNCPGV
jgi:succinyl-CoA synthetase alpha subunit